MSTWSWKKSLYSSKAGRRHIFKLQLGWNFLVRKFTERGIDRGDIVTWALCFFYLPLLDSTAFVLFTVVHPSPNKLGSWEVLPAEDTPAARVCHRNGIKYTTTADL
jgi:hypothetical protein